MKSVYEIYYEETGEWLPPYMLIDLDSEQDHCNICWDRLENCGGHVP